MHDNAIIVQEIARVWKCEPTAVLPTNCERDRNVSWGLCEFVYVSVNRIIKMCYCRLI